MDSAAPKSPSDEILVEACIKGDTSKLQDMLQASRQKSSAQPSASLSPFLTTTMLTEAIKHDHLSTIRLILRNLPPETEVSEEPIGRALLSPSIDMYKTLFAYDPNIIHTPIFDGRDTQLGKALSVPTTPEKLQVLLTCGLKPTADPFSMSELIFACGKWQTQSVTLCTQLLAHGARLQHSGALAAAAKTGRIEVVRWLLEQGADVNDVVTNAALVESRHRGHPWPALHTAIKEGHADVVRLLLKKGADPEVLDGDGRTAFEVAEKGACKEEMLALLKE